MRSSEHVARAASSGCFQSLRVHHRHNGMRLAIGKLRLLAIVPLLDAMVRHSSCVLVHGRFNSLCGLLSALD
ncbi:hypothetical protein KAX17_13995, partial [Candidatus Bipolaricaulota bacterium]|nr:hypothetical protein [Candidatus Bipolaricaulota bacterium]